MTEPLDPAPALPADSSPDAATLRELEQLRARAIHAELRAEAARAGMVDLDGVKLLDPAAVRLAEGSGIEGGSALMQKLRREKPWLFGASSSAAASAPPSSPPATRKATDMTTEEWRAARAELVRRR